MSESAPPVTVASSVTSARMPALGARARPAPRLAEQRRGRAALKACRRPPSPWKNSPRPAAGLAPRRRADVVERAKTAARHRHRAALNPGPRRQKRPADARSRRHHRARAPHGDLRAGGIASASTTTPSACRKKLAKIAHTSIDTVTVGGRRLYRVKLGPLPSVSVADATLEKVIHAGTGGAKVIKN